MTIRMYLNPLLVNNPDTTPVPPEVVKDIFLNIQRIFKLTCEFLKKYATSLPSYPLSFSLSLLRQKLGYSFGRFLFGRSANFHAHLRTIQRARSPISFLLFTHLLSPSPLPLAPNLQMQSRFKTSIARATATSPPTSPVPSPNKVHTGPYTGTITTSNLGDVSFGELFLWVSYNNILIITTHYSPLTTHHSPPITHHPSLITQQSLIIYLIYNSSSMKRRL